MPREFVKMKSHSIVILPFTELNFMNPEPTRSRLHPSGIPTQVAKLVVSIKIYYSMFNTFKTGRLRISYQLCHNIFLSQTVRDLTQFEYILINGY